MRNHLVPALWSLGATAIWVVLAVRSPHLTYHFAPIIAAGAWPVVGSRPRSALASGAIALSAAVGLELGDSLQGPDLVGGDAAFAEAVLFVLVGAGGGARWASSRAERRPVLPEISDMANPRGP